jgi:hypothetical protein
VLTTTLPLLQKVHCTSDSDKKRLEFTGRFLRLAVQMVQLVKTTVAVPQKCSQQDTFVEVSFKYSLPKSLKSLLVLQTTNGLVSCLMVGLFVKSFTRLVIVIRALCS